MASVCLRVNIALFDGKSSLVVQRAWHISLVDAIYIWKWTEFLAFFRQLSRNRRLFAEYTEKYEFFTKGREQVFISL